MKRSKIFKGLAVQPGNRLRVWIVEMDADTRKDSLVVWDLMKHNRKVVGPLG